FKKGDVVEVVVLNIDKENERFSLGMKQFSEDHWPHVLKDYAIGTKVSGTVVSSGDKGVVVELQTGIEGFIAKTDLPEADQAGLAERFPLNGSLDVVVQTLDERDHKILLGLASLAPEGGEAVKKSRGKKS
ncbi:MAG: 30S ribosomal protein S1, partial [Deltaproteobacteria bacterium]|nr:30S ribosomal protein S1 [Deltaproteobacteria bacterium]